MERPAALILSRALATGLRTACECFIQSLMVLVAICGQRRHESVDLMHGFAIQALKATGSARLIAHGRALQSALLLLSCP